MKIIEMNLKEQFQKEGYILVHNALNKAEIQHYIQELEQIDATKRKNSWTIPDGVVQYEAFWPIIFNKIIIKKVRQILEEDTKFMQHNDLHYGYSSFAWHRDSINRSYSIDLPDWQEAEAPYQIVRAGYYLQPEANNFHLGLVPGSHRLGEHIDKATFFKMDSHLTGTQIAKTKLGFTDYLKEKAIWIKTQPGDCVIFDPRLIHTGGAFAAHKYSFFVAYGVENIHFQQHYTYYRHLRKDLLYQAIPSQLARQLKEENLYALEEKYFNRIEGAWVPSAAYSFVANFFE